MILYATLGSSNIARSTKFYDPVMAALGIPRAPNPDEGWVGWGGTYDDGPSLWLCPPFDGGTASTGNGAMLAFAAKSAEAVDAFHKAAMENGGADEGAPGVRAHYGPHFYAAYVRDPDGNKLAAVFHKFGVKD